MSTRRRAITVATPIDLGALVREAREARGWTQTDLGARMGASRFWVAAFERGKAGVELGLAMRAAATVGLTLRVERPARATPMTEPVATGEVPPRSVVVPIDLDAIVGTTADLHLG